MNSNAVNRSVMLIRALAALTAAGLMLQAPGAFADVTVAKKAKFTGRVSVTGKTPGTTYTVWQSSAVGGGDYVSTGFPITVGADGTGTVSIPNTASGTLLVGHNIKIGDDNGPNAQPALAVIKATGWLWDPWFASVQPGMNGPALCTISQAVEGQDGVLAESWRPGTVFVLSVDPAEAHFVNMGCHIQGEGDLRVELVQLSLQSVAFRVVADPTMDTNDDVLISGLGLDVLAPLGGSVGMYLTFNGCTDLYTNGLYEETICGGGTYEYERLSVGNPPPPCDPDVNCDGSINGFDIEATEQAVNGDYSNFCQPTADLNNDGAENGFDIETEEQRVNGAPCF